jgi:transcription factor AP-4
MSYCYADDDTSDPASPPQHHYHHLMPESPLQHKLSANNSTTNSHISRAGSNMSPNSQLEHEKRVRREIANSNERRRMQSINTGFQSLKILIPHSCGEKLSKACILQRAADHIKSLETEKLKLQSQNEQFRILIKSFQIDSTSVLQAQRRLSTNDPDESVLLLNNETKPTDEPTEDQLRLYHDTKNRHTFIQNWHDVAQYVQTQKDDQQHYYHPTSSASYRTNPKQSSTSDTTYMIVKQNQPSQRCYKTNSLDQNNDNEIVIVERCQLRAQSVDTNNNNNNNNSLSSDHTVSRRNLQTIVEAIRHLEGDDALANMNPQQSTSQQEDLPAQLKAMINEKFQQQQTNKSPSSANTIYQQTINIYEQQHQQQSSTSHEIDLHQKPPKKRKITYNENDDTIDQQTILQKQDLPPISSPDVHHHEQISSESPPPQTLMSNLVVRSPPTVAQLLQEHLIQRTVRYPPPPLLTTNIQRHQQP